MGVSEINRVIIKPFSRDRFELAQPYHCVLEINGERVEININKGFKSDGASIPRIFWSFFPPNSPEYLTAAIIHDNLCGKAAKTANKSDRLAAQLFADRVFFEAMKNIGVKMWKARLFYFWVKFWHRSKGILNAFND